MISFKEIFFQRDDHMKETLKFWRENKLDRNVITDYVIDFMFVDE